MRAGVGLLRQGRWWLSGTATLLVHVAATLALPDGTRPKSSSLPAQQLVWISSSSAVTAQSHNEQRDPATTTASAPAAPRPHQHARHAKARAVAPLASPPQPQPASKRAEPNGPELSSAGASPAADKEAGSSSSVVLSRAELVGLGLAEPHAQASAGSLASGSLQQHGSLRGPRLLAHAHPCSGYFPAVATTDHGSVQISVQVDEAGRAQAVRLLHEAPGGQSFGRAASACAASLRFSPALDAHGTPVPGDAKLELHFDRRSSDS